MYAWAPNGHLLSFYKLIFEHMNDQAVLTKSSYILDRFNSFLNYSDQLDKITWNLKYDCKMDP